MGQPASRLTDMHVCPMLTPGVPPIPHVGGPIVGPGAVTVLIGGMPAANVGSMCVCVGPPDSIVKGSMTVLVGGAPAARLGDMTAHGGSIVLGAAGLMRGYKATAHWGLRDSLTHFGATPVDARVVTDRNRVSGGGVTAGIDFGLVLLAKLLGEDIAKVTQLALEYDPAPPFDAGTPRKAGPEVMKKMQQWLGPAFDSMTPMCIAAGKKMGNYTPVAN